MILLSLIVTESFQNMIIFASGLSDFHKMILTILKSTFPKVGPKQIVSRKCKNFDLHNFKRKLEQKCNQLINMKHSRKNFLKY